MIETAPISELPAAAGQPQRRPPRPYATWAIAIVVLVVAVVFVGFTRIIPGYDAYGWLVWGKQTLHWNLDTNGAPSWKPLTFLFTLPFALAGRAQPFLWMVADVAVSLAGAVLAGRIAYRLAGPSTRRPWAPVAGAVFAGIAVVGGDGYWQLIAIANSDPMVLTLCLAAIDGHLAGRPRLAFVMLVLAALGRPEAWLFAVAYAAWLSWRFPRARPLALLGLLAIPVLWFGVSALTAKSIFRAGDLALNAQTVIHGNKIRGVFGRFFGLYPVPVWIAAAGAMAIALAGRLRVWWALAGCALFWVVIEIGFALHGWSAVPRVLMEPAGVMVALTGAGVGRALAAERPVPRTLRLAAPVAVAVLVATLVPTGLDRGRDAKAQIVQRQQTRTKIDRLQAAIDRKGGARAFLRCGQPVTFVGYQSTVAWLVGLNVGNVGYKPGRSIRRGLPIIVFKPHGMGWQIRPFHIRPAERAACARLKMDTDFG